MRFIPSTYNSDNSRVLEAASKIALDYEIEQAAGRLEYQRIHMDASFFNVLALRIDQYRSRERFHQELRERANTYRMYRDRHKEAGEALKQLKLKKTRLYAS